MITFTPLKEDHFPLLLKWLMTPHVRAWWDQDVPWTLELIEEKYGCYVQGFKRVRRSDSTIERPVHAFVIECDTTPIGYIQYYDVRDWVQEDPHIDLSKISESLASIELYAGIDIYIGEEAYLGKGIGTNSIREFVNNYVFRHFDACIIDPETNNTRAINSYKKAGFKTVGTAKDGEITMMLWIK